MRKILLLLVVSVSLAANLSAAPKRKLPVPIKTVKRAGHICQHCEEGPYTKAQLKKHECKSTSENTAEELVSSKKEKCQMPDCHSVINKISMKQHLFDKHHVCNYDGHNVVLKNAKELFEHTENEHPKRKVYFCDKCENYLHTREKKFEAHAKKCGVYKESYCTECEKTLTKQKMDRHLISKHYFCPSCCPDTEWSVDRTLSDLAQRESLAEHILERHKRRKVFICYNNGADDQPCPYIGCTEERANLHFRTKHPGGIPLELYKGSKEGHEVKEPQFKCPICPELKNFQRLQNLRDHVLSIHLDCPFDIKNECGVWRKNHPTPKTTNEEGGMEQVRRDLYDHIKKSHPKMGIHISSCAHIISSHRSRVERHKCCE